jgi:hypothetical protein
MQRIKITNANSVLRDCGYSNGDIVTPIKVLGDMYFVLNQRYGSNPWIEEIGYELRHGYFELTNDTQEEPSCI